MIFKERLFRWAAVRPWYSWYALTGFVCLLFVMAWWYGSYQPLRRRLAKTYAAIDRGTESVGITQAVTTDATARSYCAGLPFQGEALLQAVAAEVSEQGLELTAMGSAPSDERGTSTLVCRGSFENVVNFLNYLETVSALVLTRCDMELVPGTTDISATLVLACLLRSPTTS